MNVSLVGRRFLHLEVFATHFPVQQAGAKSPGELPLRIRTLIFFIGLVMAWGLVGIAANLCLPFFW